MDTWKRDKSLSRKILKISLHSSVIRGAWAGWKFLTLSKAFFFIFKSILFLDFSTFQGGTRRFSLNIGKEISLFFYVISQETADLKFVLRLSVISFVLPQLNIAHHIKYTINLFSISYYQPNSSQSSKQPLSFILQWRFWLLSRNMLPPLHNVICNSHVYQIIVYKMQPCSHVKKRVRNKADTISTYAFK